MSDTFGPYSNVDTAVPTGPPQFANVIFQHNFYNGRSTPEIGGTPTYARTGSVYYADTAFTLSQVAANAMPFPAYKFGYSNMGPGGIEFSRATTNSLIWSENFTNWTAVGGGSATSNVSVSPNNTTTADRISGSSSGDGLTLSSSTAAASLCGVFSVFLKSSSGNPTVTIKVMDNTSSEIGVTQCTLETYWNRFEVTKIFSAAASGNAKVQIIVGNTSVVEAWGAQLEIRNLGSESKREAGPYVSTNGSTGTCGVGTYSIPNATLTQSTTKGSLAIWIAPRVDELDIATGQTLTIASVSGDQLEMDIGSITNLFVSGSVACQSDTFENWTPNRWQHYVFTWDTDADSYKIYRNGVQVGSSSTVLGAPSYGVNDLYIGTYFNGNYPAESRIAEVILWKVALSASEALQVYTNRQTLFDAGLDSGKLFEVDLGTTPIPVVGDKQYWYQQDGPGTYFNSSTTVASVSEGGYPAPAYALGNNTVGGLALYGTNTNYMLQSEAPATTWTAVGAPTVTNSVGTFLGTVTFGTINGTATQGIQQTGSLAVASNQFVGSLFASVSSGTLGFTITLEGGSGGTPESATSSTQTATTTPQWFYFYKSFTGAATGNIRMKILLTGTGTLRLGGMSTIRVAFSNTEPFFKAPVYYVRTTTAEVRQQYNSIVYPAARHVDTNRGTFLAWAFIQANGATEFIAPMTNTLWGMHGHDGGWYFTVRIGPVTRTDIRGSAWNASITMTKNTWHRYAMTWEPESSNWRFKFYVDGTLTDSQTVSTKPPPAKKMWFGYDGGNAGSLFPSDYWNGGIKQIEIHGSAFTQTQITNDYNNTKATYGR